MDENIQGNFTIQMIRGDKVATISAENVIELNIVEDIYSLCMAGSLIFYDKEGWTETFEIIGFDPLYIIYQEGGINVEKMFVVYNYEAIVEDSNITTGLKKARWFFVEPMFTSLVDRRYSRAWAEGKKGSDIITDICKDMIKTENFEKFENTNETFDNFYMPYWSPAESIKWIMKRCSGEKSKLPGYLFYYNSKGANFVTMETLVTSKDREKGEDGKNVKYIFTDQSAADNKILDWYINPPDRLALKYLSGAKRHGFDFDGKYIHNPSYTYKDSVDKYSLLGKSTLFWDLSNSRTNVIIDGESELEKIDNINDHEFIRRYSKQFSAGLVVRGHSRRYAGMIIDVAWKSVDYSKKTDKMLEGLFMVKSITHQFTSGINVSPVYRQLLTCLKTGYELSESQQLMPAAKTISDTYVNKT